jgi:phosphoglycolate phosphatase-like HAD superfamily hydrolase
MYRTHTKPVVALDIDGTLGDYHAWFLQFAEMWFGKPMPPADKNTDGVPLYRWMGVSKAKYRECKLAYRQGGLKRGMPCYPGAADLSRSIRKAGGEVWICTTRPYLRLDNIDPDTRHWLRRNGIQYDGVLWGHNKYRDLVRIVGADRVVAVLDDLPELLTQSGQVGAGVAILRDQPYNRFAALPLRVEDMQQAKDAILDEMACRKGKSCETNL